MNKELIVVRGGGDLATGVIQKLFRAGLPVLVLEVPQPTAIRRTVALCEAVYDGFAQVEDVPCRLAANPDAALAIIENGKVALLVDPAGDAIGQLRPACVVDAILAKRNLGTHRGMAPATIALGPGFAAGREVDAVVETMRGHDLGRLILEGQALPNTGVPGEIGGQGMLRVIHAPAAGAVRPLAAIGQVVRQDDILLEVGGETATAPFTGLVRGMIRPGLPVPKGMKVADIDPRTGVDTATISDKARCIGGAVLEAFLMLRRRHKNQHQSIERGPTP